MYINYKHQAINHSLLQFAKVKFILIIEGFWSLLKRGVKSQFHHISSKYMKNILMSFAGDITIGIIKELLGIWWEIC